MIAPGSESNGRESNGRQWRTIVETPLGPMGGIESDAGVVLIRVGYREVDELERELRREFPQANPRRSSPLADALRRYASGQIEEFADVDLDLTGWTAFSRRVLSACRQIGYGQTGTYTELARRAGSERAYRAAGSTMARNRWPLVVPCHRILRKDGGLGGYSAPRGLDFKNLLLEMEAQAGRGGVGSFAASIDRPARTSL